MHLLEHNDEATKAGSATKSYDQVRLQTNPDEAEGECKGRWMLLIELRSGWALRLGRRQR